MKNLILSLIFAETLLILTSAVFKINHFHYANTVIDIAIVGFIVTALVALVAGINSIFKMFKRTFSKN